MFFVRHWPARSSLPNSFDQIGRSDAVFDRDDMINDLESSENTWNSADAAQYQYPYPSVINHGPGSPPVSRSSGPLSSASINAQGYPAPPQTFAQAPNSASEWTTASTLVSTTVSAPTPSLLLSTTSTSPSLAESTTAHSTLIVPPPSFASTPRSSSSVPPSTSFPSRSFYNAESFSASTTEAISGDSTSPPAQLSPTAIGILIVMGGTIFLVGTICILRCVLRQCRHRRRLLKESAFDFTDSSEKNRWGTEKSRGEGSPSTIFGGKERTGLTPQPSWVTFDDVDRAATRSPYPLGLVPPPLSILRVPSLRTYNPAGPGQHQGLNSTFTNYDRNDETRWYPPQNRPFEPPMITITNSSPRKNVPWLPSQTAVTHSRGRTREEHSSVDGISPSHSYNRVSVYSDPVHGAQLVKPPRVALVNDDLLLSESDRDPRQSGWSSWDDNVGVELGITIDRKHFPRRRSRLSVSRGKKDATPLRVTLDPVKEVSDTSDTEALKTSPAQPQATPKARLYPQSPYKTQGHIRRGPPSVKHSPRSGKGVSPRVTKQGPAQTLYDLPKFEALSPSVNSSTRVTSPTSIPPSPMRDEAKSPKRRSKRDSRRTSSKNMASTATARPPSLVSGALSDVYTYALSSMESEEMQGRRRSRLGDKPISPRTNDAHRFASCRTPMTPASSRTVSDVVGELMMKAYGEEGSMPSPSFLPLSEKGHDAIGGGRGGGGNDMVSKEANRVQKSNQSVGLGLNVPRQSPQPPQSSRIAPSTLSTFRSRALAGGDGDYASRKNVLALSPLSEYSQDASRHSGMESRRYADRDWLSPEPQRVPSLPPAGMPSLYQLKLMQEMPDYRSATYSMYGMYRDGNRTSPLQGSPTAVPYRDGTGKGLEWRAEVI